MSLQKLLGGRWKITGRTLGAGGQAQVHVVTDVEGSLPGEWAAKVLLNSMRSSRIEREITVAKQLYAAGAPVIEIVDDFLQTEPEADKPWFVMRIANDGSLGKHITPGQVYGGSIRAALVLFRDINFAVSQLHSRNVAHRDLKPDNVLLDGKKPILADLGLCLPLDDVEGDRLTGVLERIGSLHFLPKEAFGRRPLDQDQFAFDAYALGKILYLLVTGEKLPGFVSPVDPEYDLTKKENSPLIRSINRTLRGLLHDSPLVRLASLSQLDEQINDLLETFNSPQQSPSGIEAILLQAADSISVQTDVYKDTAVDQNIKDELDAIRDEIFSGWNDSECIAQIDKLVIQPNSASIEFLREAAATKLRSQVFGPNIHTRRALEPIEDLGYPVFVTNESGCAVGIQPKQAGISLPQVWLGALVSSKDDKAIIATATTCRMHGTNEVCDIILGTQRTLILGIHDAGLVTKVRALAEESIQLFAKALANKFAK